MFKVFLTGATENLITSKIKMLANIGKFEGRSCKRNKVF